MHKEEEIYRKLNETTDDVKKVFFLSQLLTETILQDKLENSSEEEYFEGLIFSTFIVVQSVSTNKISKDEIISKIFIELMMYAREVDKLLIIFLENEYFNNSFFIGRYKIIHSEIIKLNNNTNYLAPILLNNLYINPLNNEKLTTNEIIEKIGSIELLKHALKFKVRYKFFLGNIDKIIQLLNNQNNI